MHLLPGGIPIPCWLAAVVFPLLLVLHLLLHSGRRNIVPLNRQDHLPPLPIRSPFMIALLFTSTFGTISHFSSASSAQMPSNTPFVTQSSIKRSAPWWPYGSWLVGPVPLETDKLAFMSKPILLIVLFCLAPLLCSTHANHYIHPSKSSRQFPCV